MKALYKKMGRHIIGYLAVTMPHVDPVVDLEPDTILSGRRGWIFKLREYTRVGVAECLQGGGEKITYIDIKHLAKAVSRIDLPESIAEQLHYANNPNERKYTLREIKYE